MAKRKVFEFVQNEYRDFTASQYKQMVCTSYTGGASWCDDCGYKEKAESIGT